MAALAEQIVVIFGGSSGMGKATAVAVRAAGATPWIIGRDEAKLKVAADERSTKLLWSGHKYKCISGWRSENVERRCVR